MKIDFHGDVSKIATDVSHYTKTQQKDSDLDKKGFAKKIWSFLTLFFQINPRFCKQTWVTMCFLFGVYILSYSKRALKFLFSKNWLQLFMIELCFINLKIYASHCLMATFLYVLLKTLIVR